MKVCWITSPISITSKGERPQPKHARHITFTLWKRTFKHSLQQMADSSEIQSKPDAEIQQSKRDQQDSSFLETLVPIPDFFFNIKAEIEPIGGSKWRIRIFGYVLYFITLCVMFGSFAYYSLPAQRVSLESIVTSEWQKPGFVCKPLQKTALHGLSTDWSFDECVSATSSPSAESIVSVQKNDGSTQFDFRFAAKDG